MIALIVGLVLAALILVCMKFPVMGDFYALKVYPAVSSFLSRISAPFSFSLQGVVVFVLALVGVVVLVRWRKAGPRRSLRRLATLLVWTFVWFYAGWCLNYSRSDIYHRVEVSQAQYDSTAFSEFMYAFRETLNEAYVADTVDEATIEREIKGFYASVPAKYGLCKPRPWQHVKPMLIEDYHAATGVSGYMGPLFAEFHVNRHMPSCQYPFTWAHECSHLLGVSSEDEANWWAWNACMSSSVPAIRYSACISMLSYIIRDARRCLSEADYEAWASAIRPEVTADMQLKHDYWSSKRNPTLNAVQGWAYDLFLKSNNVSSGIQSYSQVLTLLLSLDYHNIGG